MLKQVGAAVAVGVVLGAWTGANVGADRAEERLVAEHARRAQATRIGASPAVSARSAKDTGAATWPAEFEHGLRNERETWIGIGLGAAGGGLAGLALWLVSTWVTMAVLVLAAKSGCKPEERGAG